MGCCCCTAARLRPPEGHSIAEPVAAGRKNPQDEGPSNEPVAENATCERARSAESDAPERSNSELVRSTSRRKLEDLEDSFQADDITKTPSSKSLKMTWRRRHEDALLVRTAVGEEIYGLTAEKVADLTVLDLRIQVAEAMVATGKDILPDAVNLVAFTRPLEDGEQLASLLKEQREPVLEVLALLREVPQYDAEQPVLEQLETLALMLRSPSVVRRLQAAVQIRQVLSTENNPPIQQIIDAGLVPVLLKLCDLSEPENIQNQAAWAVLNIASGTTEHTTHVVQNGAIDRYIALLASPSEGVREQCVWALGNIAGDSPAFRDMVLDAGVLPLMLEILNNSSNISILRQAVWAISNLLRGKPPPSLEQVAPACGPLVRILADEKDTEVLSDTCWGLSYLTDGPNERIDVLLKQEGACEHLVRIMREGGALMQAPALRCVGNVCSGSEEQTDEALRCGGLTALEAMLQHSKRSIRKEAVWSISNVLAGTVPQIQSVLDHSLLPKVLHLGQEGDLEIQKEVVFCLTNIVDGGTPAQVWSLVDKTAFEFLTSAIVDATPLAKRAMNAILGIMRKGQQPLVNSDAQAAAALLLEANGEAAIMFALRSESDELKSQATKLIEEFFPEMEALRAVASSEAGEEPAGGLDTGSLAREGEESLSV